MKPAHRLFWIVVVLGSGALNLGVVKADEKSPDESKSVALTPVPGSETDLECRVLDMRTGKTTIVKGRQAVYMSGLLPQADAAPHDYPIPVSAFAYAGTHWIGLTGDLYVYRDGGLLGMATMQGGFSWLDNLASNRPNRTLKEEIAAFRQQTPIAELFHAFLRKWGRDIDPQAPACWTKFSDVIPAPYLYNLQSNPPGSATIARAKFVAAEFDGKQLKVTLADQTGVISPSLWIDLDTKQAVKAENYEYDPDAKDRETERKALKSIGIGN